MERRLIIMRHAKSTHDDPTLSDHQRPLSDRGWSQAREIAERLVQNDWVPQSLISSDSRRTRQTWEAMTALHDEEITPLWNQHFYLAGTEAICSALEDLDDEITDVMVLGHNPGWEAALAYFTGEYHTLTTSNAVLLSAQADHWTDLLRPKAFELVSILRPRKG